MRLIGDTYTLSISLLGLSLMSILNKDVKKSKLIAGDLFKLFKLDKNLEEIYTKIINEQYQKFLTANSIYSSLLEYDKKLLDQNNEKDKDQAKEKDKSKKDINFVQ